MEYTAKAGSSTVIYMGLMFEIRIPADEIGGQLWSIFTPRNARKQLTSFCAPLGDYEN